MLRIWLFCARGCSRGRIPLPSFCLSRGGQEGRSIETPSTRYASLRIATAASPLSPLSVRSPQHTPHTFPRHRFSHRSTRSPRAPRLTDVAKGPRAAHRACPWRRVLPLPGARDVRKRVRERELVKTVPGGVLSRGPLAPSGHSAEGMRGASLAHLGPLGARLDDAVGASSYRLT